MENFPFLADRVPVLAFDDVKLLDVQVNRLQRWYYNNVLAIAVDHVDRPPPRAVRLVSRLPALRRLGGYLVAIGPLSEHAPAYARR